MINTALFCAIRYYYETITTDLVNGMIYPSPMVYGDAVNIVMMPHVVDRCLQADDCFIFKYIRGEDNAKYFETDICSNPSKVLGGKLNICDDGVVRVFGVKLAISFAGQNFVLPNAAERFAFVSRRLFLVNHNAGDASFGCCCETKQMATLRIGDKAAGH